MTLSRRDLIAGGLSIPALGALAGCATTGAPLTQATLPTLAEPSPAIVAAAAGGLPPYGPNGTHYPTKTPRLGATAAKEIEVDCSWGAIARALRTLGHTQVRKGVVIRVRPGRLVGYGSTSGARPVLEGVGKKTWERHVLICPRDGYGSVTMVDQGFRINKCHRLAFFGFTGPTVGWVITNSTSMQMGWGIWSTVNITKAAKSIGLYELVAGFRRDENDTVGIRPNGADKITVVKRYGCVFGPSVKRAGSSSHSDTWQIEGTSPYAIGPITSIDCIDIGSSNAAIIAHTRVSLLEFRHCLVLADTLPWKLFPLESGDYQGKPNALAGGCRDVRFYDSHVVGSLGGLRYTYVGNTKINYQPQSSQRPRAAGKWTVDTSMTSWTRDDIVALAGTDFTQESFEQYWRW